MSWINKGAPQVSKVVSLLHLSPYKKVNKIKSNLEAVLRDSGALG